MSSDALTGRLTAWLNDPDDPLWERPGPTATQVRRDIAGAAILVLLGVGMTALTKSVGMVVEDEETWRAYVAVPAMALPLATRRRFPVTTLLVASAMFVVLSLFSLEGSVQFLFQVTYFATLYSAVAWAPDRRLLWLALGLVLLAMGLWVVISYTGAASVSYYTDGSGQPNGPIDELTANVLYGTAMNVAFFGGAIVIGRNSWRAALQRSRLVDQTERVREQAGELARRAVVDERLRIARELHDVVAHHISVIGVQAGAARRVLGKDVDAATQALRTVETSSRDAVGEMRSLLGVLRSETEVERDRSPEPDLAGLEALAEEYRDSGLDVQLHRAEETRGDLDLVPAPLALSIYRTVQESLTNVVRHSTATQALVTLRTWSDGEADGAWVEAEIVDDGRPRTGTAGSGFGLRGIRERIALHGGEVEIGPRRTGDGWRVRARFRVRILQTAPTA
ncbi:sensor histidine kinase [Georgenia deserti]|uniref:histidine kinase n=1 Tax=Georgenia deserti TaxID=2093781 RepID=A0ABW4L4S5_9MICO